VCVCLSGAWGER